MPVNPGAIQAALQTNIPNLISLQGHLNALHDEALKIWLQPPINQTELRHAALEMLENDRRVRLAIPTDEVMNQPVPAPAPPDQIYLVAVDGAQVHPHAGRYPWSMVNLGAASWLWPSGPEYGGIQAHVRTNLYLGPNRLDENGSVRISEHIDLLRYVGERLYLAELGLQAAKQHENVLCLLDGPIELYSGRNPSAAGSYDPAFARCRKAYESLNQRHVPYAGYVDAPESALLVTLMERLMSYYLGDRNYSLDGLTDVHLLAGWLPPGHRTAIYTLGTNGYDRYGVDSAVHICYINVGDKDRPQIARVEFPGWICGTEAFEMLHALIVAQAGCVQDTAYPYLLGRADETAYVSPQEVEAVEAQIANTLQLAGVQPMTLLSAKTSFKGISRKWR